MEQLHGHAGRLFNGRWIWVDAKLQMGNFTIHGIFFMLLKKLNRSHASTPSWAEFCYFIYETNCCRLGCSNVASFQTCKKRHQMATLLGILSTESLGVFYGYWYCAIFLSDWQLREDHLTFLFFAYPLLCDALWLPCFCGPNGWEEMKTLDQLLNVMDGSWGCISLITVGAIETLLKDSKLPPIE